MIEGLTSVIIPAYNAAATLATAIHSALIQTAKVEVIVVDDGSTDETIAQAFQYAYADPDMEWHNATVRMLSIPHQGVAAARNHGLEHAEGEFIQFLDADDTLEPGKIAAQLVEMDEHTGWVICDTRIIEVGGREQMASERYGYANLGINGWIADLLALKNFIPVHAPLYRRSAIGEIRFEDRLLEDWCFLYAVAKAARCRYLPDVLCTYRKRAGSRNADTAGAVGPLQSPGFVPPLRLNLGCGKPNCIDWHPLPGFINLDKSMGWRFEDGLGAYADGSVDAVSVSHALMYVAEKDWPFVCSEFARVLRPGGIVRITEDDTTNPASSIYGGWRGSERFVTLTDPAMTRRHLEAAGFNVRDVAADQTFYADTSLIQAQHRPAPHSFWIEGIRESAVLFAPHADDESLFASFLLIRHKPRIVICYPSPAEYGGTGERWSESCAAAAILGAGPVDQWEDEDIEARMRALDGQIRPTRVFAPSPDSSHPEHVAVALAAIAVFGDRVTQYQTYNAAGKVRTGTPTPFEPGWPEKKREALACCRTQRDHPRARIFFDEDQYGLDEWTA